jgi:hypothetical protein
MRMRATSTNVSVRKIIYVFDDDMMNIHHSVQFLHFSFFFFFLFPNENSFFFFFS